MDASMSTPSTPENKITRDNLTVLITNNMLNNSVEISPDCEMMETDSPVRKPRRLPVSKKLFHSPMAESPNEAAFTRDNSDTTATARNRKAIQRKQMLIPGNSEKMKRAYIQELEEDGISSEEPVGTRTQVLMSLLHNKEYCVQIDR